MTNPFLGPRKRRTRQHVIADQSVNHVERFIIDEGHIAQRWGSDYGYDLTLITFDEDGYIEPASVYFQLKASDSLRAVGTCYVFDLNIRDYNLWMMDEMPVILVLFDAPRRRAYWLAVQQYFQEDAGRQPKSGAKTVRLRVPRRQVVNRRAVAVWRKLKWDALRWAKGGGREPH
ncbi:MAG TPA: DUF4365 domain-containing protein [Gemmataceae bacterium]|nr:DUF4365 domain-containing protein [Gemmataceae bacterium]